MAKISKNASTLRYGAVVIILLVVLSFLLYLLNKAMTETLEPASLSQPTEVTSHTQPAPDRQHNHVHILSESELSLVNQWRKSSGRSISLSDRAINSWLEFNGLESLNTTTQLHSDVNNWVASLYCPHYRTVETDYSLAPVPFFELPVDYIPARLVIVDDALAYGVVCLEQVAAKALIDMSKAAKADGEDLLVVSSFRRYEVQDNLLNRRMSAIGEAAKNYVAEPGHSEHQLGTTVDFGASYNGSLDSFGKTSEFGWLQDNAHNYGFVLSYPSGKRDITGYFSEPWHWRYVGVDLATVIYESQKAPIEILAPLWSSAN